jgi:hypothetical protein
MISTADIKYDIKLLDYIDDKECFNRASVLPNAVLEMSGQFVLNCLTSHSGIFHAWSLPDTMATECIF